MPTRSFGPVARVGRPGRSEDGAPSVHPVRSTRAAPDVGVTTSGQTGHMTSTLPADTGRSPSGGAPVRALLDDPVPGSGVLGPRLRTTQVDPGTGISTQVGQATALLADIIATLDPARLTGTDAAGLYRMFATVERLSMAGKTLLAPRVDESGVWRDGGHRSPASMLAELEGVPTGQARNTLEVGHRLPDLPGTEEALRSGTLSGPKVSELSGAAVLDPGSEGILLAGAADQPLQKVKERCQRARMTAEQRDPMATVRRIHAARQFSSWTDAEGAFCFQGRDTADRGAKILEQLQHAVVRMRSAERVAGRGQQGTAVPPAARSDRALRADAFFLLLTGGVRSSGCHADGPHDDSDPPDEQVGPGHGPAREMLRPSSDWNPTCAPATDDGSGAGAEPASGGTGHPVIDRPPTCSIMVRVDLDALLRGRVGAGEVCEIDNQGPIPVAMARDLANDSFLRLVYHRSGDIRAVSHLGRTVNRRLRTALAHRDRCCVVPGCGVPFGLEIDHVVPFALGGPTELSNLALLCHHHHYLKTYEGWTLERSGTADDGSPTWAFLPLPAFGTEPDPPGG